MPRIEYAHLLHDNPIDLYVDEYYIHFETVKECVEFSAFVLSKGFQIERICCNGKGVGINTTDDNARRLKSDFLSSREHRDKKEKYIDLKGVDECKICFLDKELVISCITCRHPFCKECICKIDYCANCRTPK